MARADQRTFSHYSILKHCRAVVSLCLLHKLALWAESRGYIYYVNKEPSRSSLGNASLEVQTLIEPGKRAQIEVVREERSEEADSGDPPEPGESTRDSSGHGAPGDTSESPEHSQADRE